MRWHLPHFSAPLEVPALTVGPEQKAKKTHSNSVASRVPRARRKRQRLPPSLLIENASDRDPRSAPKVCSEAFPIKASDNPEVIVSFGRVGRLDDPVALQHPAPRPRSDFLDEIRSDQSPWHCLIFPVGISHGREVIGQDSRSEPCLVNIAEPVRT